MSYRNYLREKAAEISHVWKEVMESATNAMLVVYINPHFTVTCCKLFVYRDLLVLGKWFYLLRCYL